MIPLDTFRLLMGKPVMPASVGLRAVAVLGLLLLAVGFWAVLMSAGDREPSGPELLEPRWWREGFIWLFVAGLATSILHKLVIISGIYEALLGLAAVLAVMMGGIGLMPFSPATTVPLHLILSYKSLAAFGLLVGSIWMDIFMWLYVRMKQVESDRERHAVSPQ